MANRIDLVVVRFQRLSIGGGIQSLDELPNLVAIEFDFRLGY
jgi:hypothetical protein